MLDFGFVGSETV